MNPWPLAASGLFHGLRTATLSSVRIVDEGGLEDLRSARPLLVVANHQSHADAPVVLHALPTQRRRQVRFVASFARFSRASEGASLRERVERWFMRGLAVHAYRSVLVGGDESGLQSIERIAEALAGGATVVMFPEGTRSRDGRLGRLRPGTSMLAIGSGAWVLPMRIDGTLEALPKSIRLPRFRNRILVRVRRPLVAQPSETHAQFNTRLAHALSPHLADEGVRLP